MTYSHTHAQPRLAPAGGARRSSKFSRNLRVLIERMESAFVRWSNRRAIYKLAGLDNRSLQDMGITRADIDWALSQPWHVDPSDILNECVQTRRKAARWAREFRAN